MASTMLAATSILTNEATNGAPPNPLSHISSPHAESLWKIALDSLKDEHKNAIKFPSNDKLTILEDILQAVETKKEACREKRWKYTKGRKEVIVRDQLEKIVAWVNKFKEIGDLAVQYDPVHAALPWAGVRFFLQIPVGYFEIAGAMLEGLEVVTNLISRCAILEKLYLQTSSASETEKSAQGQFTSAVLKLYVSILKFFSKARNYYDHGTFGKLARSVVQTPSSSIGVHIDKLEKARINVEACAHLVVSSRSCNMSGDILRLESLLRLMDEPIHRSANQLSDLKDFLKEGERKTLFRWLSSIQHKQHHKNVGRDFLSRSGQWLISKPEFVGWKKESASSMLWLHGIPAQSAYSSPPLFAYFYCTRSDAERERANPDEIMRSILKQLSCSKANLPIREPVAGEYKKLKDEADDDGSEPIKWTTPECVDLIIQILQENSATIIVDALDECDPERRHELLFAFDRIIQESASVVKIFASSREDDDIKCRLEVSPNIFIHASDNGEDIERFVHDQVDRAIRERRLLNGDVSIKLKGQIVQVLTERSQGMFRWTELQIQNLCDVKRMKHESDIDQELGRLPTTLRKSYDLIYQQITDLGKTSRGIVERTLSWLLCAQRTLKPKEIIAAVSLDPEGTHVSLLGMCCNLVLLDEETLRFAHLSVREYLEEHGDYEPSRRHALVLDRCLETYLLPLSKISTTARFSPSAFSRDHLSLYSTFYWPAHCQLAGGSLPCYKPTTKLLRFVFDGSGAAISLQAWTIYGRSIISPTLPTTLPDRLTWIFLSPPHPIFSASCFGFCWAFNTLTALGYSDWSRWGLDCRSGLHAAAEFGMTNAILLLLNRGVDMNAVDGKYFRPAISWAAENGHTEAVEVFLNRGAIGSSASGKTPLMLATRNGHQRMTELLLSRGADPGHEDERLMNRTALGWAAENGHTEIVELLCNTGGNERIPYNFETALISAAQGGHCRIAEVLLDRGPKIDLNGAKGGSALLKAAANGHHSVIELFLRKGASAEQKTSEGETPLILAAKAGYNRIVWLLLDSGVSIDPRDRHGATALSKAAANGDLATVQSLLGKGASIDLRERNGETALLRAAENGSKAVVGFLLSKGAQVEAETMEGKTPLIVAAQNGHEEAVEVLLSNQANINAKDSDGNTSLLNASNKGVIRLLVSNGADIHHANMEGTTRLHLTSRFDDGKLVELLLANGADKMQKDAIGRTAYDMALNNSNFRVLELLNSWQRNPLGLDRFSGALILSPELHGHFRHVVFRGALVLYQSKNRPQTTTADKEDWYAFYAASVQVIHLIGSFESRKKARKILLWEPAPPPVLFTSVEFSNAVGVYRDLDIVRRNLKRWYISNDLDHLHPQNYPKHHDTAAYNPRPYMNDELEGGGTVQQLLLAWRPLQTRKDESGAEDKIHGFEVDVVVALAALLQIGVRVAWTLWHGI
ncbi:Ankyrin repeat domain-containing protein [Lachnellula suecica]|uniref:Ankyrin repeat domain-containing protein n=1 Tax=Lachnellula suecica TaxID=602035 RepID=A0A8T9BV04_9HELO|nr:Ankyrin repeat domain-containing protein [Lachnellula suecica]